jgi:glutathione synthase/RimK-type ligase-like ATP-grasp enzyme
MKLTGRGGVVVEVNDNPTLDAGIEDKVLGENFYKAVIGEIVSRLDRGRDSLGARLLLEVT